MRYYHLTERYDRKRTELEKQIDNIYQQEFNLIESEYKLYYDKSDTEGKTDLWKLKIEFIDRLNKHRKNWLYELKKNKEFLKKERNDLWKRYDHLIKKEDGPLSLFKRKEDKQRKIRKLQDRLNKEADFLELKLENIYFPRIQTYPNDFAHQIVELEIESGRR